MSLRILIIDDDVPNRFALAEYLRATGLVVDEAGDGQEGLRIFREGHTDLVITAACMPVVDGMQTLRELRSQDPKLPVIMISGRRLSREEVLRETGTEPICIFQKPVTPAELLAVLLQTCEAREPA